MVRFYVLFRYTAHEYKFQKYFLSRSAACAAAIYEAPSIPDTDYLYVQEVELTNESWLGRYICRIDGSARSAPKR